MNYVLTKKENPTAEEFEWYMNQYTEEDREFFYSFFNVLPQSIMGSLGPHSVGFIREICKICNPTSILEIGFNVGYSASMWLNFTNAVLYSVDNSSRGHTLEAFKLIKYKFGNRFHFLNVDSGQAYPLLEGKFFDFAFVDGDHSAEGVRKDLEMVRALGIKRIAMDDYWPMHGETQAVLPQSGYEVEQQWGNIVLCKLCK